MQKYVKRFINEKTACHGSFGTTFFNFMTDFFINKILIGPVSKVYSEITFIFVSLI